MKRLSFIEMMAILFAGIAGLASAVQAYVSWETRGEVSRALVFAQRMDACAKVIAAIEPFVTKARTESRAVVAGGSADGQYSLPMYYYRKSSGNAAFDAEHDPKVQVWREASAAFLIVSPPGAEDYLTFFDQFITNDIPAGKYMQQSEMIAKLVEPDNKAQVVTRMCRNL